MFLKPNNLVVLTGFLGKDPEVRRLESGAAVAKFSIATSDGYKDKASGEFVDQTEWHDIIVWRASAEYVERTLKKGMLVQLLGKLTHRTYTKQDNTKGYATEVVAASLYHIKTEKSANKGYFPTTEPGGDTAMVEHQVDPANSGSAAGGDENPADDLPF